MYTYYKIKTKKRKRKRKRRRSYQSLEAMCSQNIHIIIHPCYDMHTYAESCFHVIHSLSLSPSFPAFLCLFSFDSNINVAWLFIDALGNCYCFCFCQVHVYSDLQDAAENEWKFIRYLQFVCAHYRDLFISVLAPPLFSPPLPSQSHKNTENDVGCPVVVILIGSKNF